MDRQLRGGWRGKAVSFERLRRVDIRHLNLSKVPGLTGLNVTAVSKHLCGGATDLSLRCLANSAGRDSTFRWHGVAIATCCHGLCDWDTYIGKEFWLEQGLSAEEFMALKKLTSWGTCGAGREAGQAADLPAEGAAVEHAAAPEATEEVVEGPLAALSAEERCALGRRIKSLIDAGRAAWLRRQGFRVELVRFCDPTVSPENTLLLAWRDS
eukprot:CAMPEP_0175940168 /NCGR_PEP_ID=MMETSP0108-20121206/23647_1 /TAXON_ID=195067 ORGANISM="Goniomonas pacifica, Strain CCMP1869" /NCGR_SAMPLE_ID=MMETSP0108 /ASSEMBLY_ACC=CAM_ASM_000204 /LENGTH=210 /DNA_ID=CAMNT_0017264591 /DNA_START=15 /DNA_END=647 /DNA_ORIENTATION=+